MTIPFSQPTGIHRTFSREGIIKRVCKGKLHGL